MPVTTLVFAHTGPLAAELWHQWVFEPITAALLIASASAYGIGVRRLWRRAGRGRGIRIWEAASFAVGLLSVAVALLSPLAWLAEVAFSAHMTQHELLMLVAAPLLVFGRPLQAFLWALARERRDEVAGWTRVRAVSAAWHWLTGPAAAFALHGLTLWIWHIPSLYERALHDDAVHGVQHASFLITATLFWWGVTNGRYGRVGYGAGVLYVFLTAVHSSVLGALLTVAPVPWYPSYDAAGAKWQIDALADQQLAGLLMWVPSGLVFIVFGLALLAAWLGESERRARIAR